MPHNALLEYSINHLKELVTDASAFPFLRALLGLSSKYQHLVLYGSLRPLHDACLLDYAFQPTQLALRQKIIPLLDSLDVAEDVMNFLCKEEISEGEDPIDADRLLAFQAVAPRSMLLALEMYCRSFPPEEHYFFSEASFTKSITAVNMHWSPAKHQSFGPTCHTIILTILLCAERFLPQLPSELWLDFILSLFQVNDFLVLALKM